MGRDPIADNLLLKIVSVIEEWTKCDIFYLLDAWMGNSS